MAVAPAVGGLVWILVPLIRRESWKFVLSGIAEGTAVGLLCFALSAKTIPGDGIRLGFDMAGGPIVSVRAPLILAWFCLFFGCLCMVHRTPKIAIGWWLALVLTFPLAAMALSGPLLPMLATRVWVAARHPLGFEVLECSWGPATDGLDPPREAESARPKRQIGPLATY